MVKRDVPDPSGSKQEQKKVSLSIWQFTHDALLQIF
jgi:hypothetical protein